MMKLLNHEIFYTAFVKQLDVMPYVAGAFVRHQVWDNVHDPVRDTVNFNVRGIVRTNVVEGVDISN